MQREAAKEAYANRNLSGSDQSSSASSDRDSPEEDWIHERPAPTLYFPGAAVQPVAAGGLQAIHRAKPSATETGVTLTSMDEDRAKPPASETAVASTSTKEDEATSSKKPKQGTP